MAKTGASRSHSIDFNYSKFNFIPYVPLYDSIPILTKLRLFITDIQNAKQFNTFLLLDRYATARFYTADDLIDWPHTHLCLNPKGSSLYTNFKESNLKVFRVKLLTDTLPTLENLKQRRSDLYDTSLTCVICDEPHEYEDINHLWSCRYYRPVTQRILTQCRDLIIKKIHKRRPDAHLVKSFLLDFIPTT